MLQRLFKKKMVEQERFTAGPYVAIWIGQHTSEEQLDDYLSSGRFSEEYRFRLNERQPPEYCAEAIPRPLLELVQGFSRYERFQDAFLTRARELGIHEANSIIVFYFMVYSPEELPVLKRPESQFIGNFWFEGFE